jgi:tyrosyl-tRNA synthetase
MSKQPIDAGSRSALEALGIDVDALLAGGEGTRVVVVQAGMEDAVKTLSSGSRDQVVMTRINLETAQALDSWVDAGIAKSRSEAAALFLQEGLKIREPELQELSGALRTLESAREAVKAKAKTLMGKRK